MTHRFSLLAAIFSTICAILLSGCGMIERIQPAPTPTPEPDPEGNILIFGDALSPAWNDWSYGADLNPEATTPFFVGSRSMEVTYSEGHGGVQLALQDDFLASDFENLQFAIHGGLLGNQQINLSLIGEDGSWTDPPILIEPIANEWITYSIPFEQFGNPTFIKGVIFQEAVGRTPGTFYLDDIIIKQRDKIIISTSGPTLTVDLAGDRYAIDPHIYGLNFADDALAKELALPINRWGGNAVTRYNWKIDVSNRASDWYFLNVPNEVDVDGLPDSNVNNKYIAFNQRNAVDTLLTVPMIGWTPNGRELECGFSIEKYGEQQYADPEERCGNGMIRDKKPVKRNDPEDTSLAIGPEFVTEWVSYLVERFGSAENNGVRFYSLDNEPMLWHHTHRDVRPDPVGYDELLDLSVEYAKAVKAADPTANVLGPTVWGWTAFFYSAIDAEERDWVNPPDRMAHDDIPLVEWYLQQMAAYEAETGTRLLDYLDLHFYPQSPQVALNPAGGAGRQARRLETTRNLWDPNYLDNTWIDEPVMLIPRMREWVDANYPGTKLALTEYNWGGLEHINGALAQADVLGIFGRERLDMATLWDPPTRLAPGAFAFRMYRNYDGNGSQFGDISIPAVSSGSDSLSIFAAERSSDGALTLMVINKSRLQLNTALELTGEQLSAELEAYHYSSADLESIQKLRNVQLEDSELALTLPAYSITLYVLPADNTPQASQ